MQKRPNAAKRERDSQNQMGGRQFGNVIEPMQAQMASENRGLADDVGSNRSQHESRAKKARKKGA